MDDSCWYWEDDPPETKKERRARKKREKRNVVIQEVIDALRDPENKVIGTCHGCTNVLNDAANFLAHHYEVGMSQDAMVDRSHPEVITVALDSPVGPNAEFISMIEKDGKTKILMVTHIQPDRRTIHAIDS